MRFTFLIGNGFDLNLGLHTDFPSFLKFYLEEKHDGPLADAIKKDIETWANLEEQLGVYAGTIHENDIDKFFDEKEELEASLLRYLTQETERKLILESTGAEEFRDKIVKFYTQITNLERDHYNEQLKKINTSIQYSFINFNYTTYLDEIIANAKKIEPFSSHVYGGTGVRDHIQEPLHIHGTTNNEMILGINDASQIITENPHSSIINYLSKPLINRALGNGNITLAQSMINDSRYICVFGMSIGITDKDWWAYIIEWLRKSADNRLILFMHDKTGSSPIGSKAARMQDEMRKRFLTVSGKMDVYEEVSQQIIVRYNTALFSFEHIKLEEKDE